MTTRAVTPRVLDPPARLGHGLSVFPGATAMVWPGPGHAHEAVAVPGVRLAPGDALVEMELATVCGSDVHTFTGQRTAPTPLILGHEQVGRVVALGRGGARSVDGRRLEIGARVVWSVSVPCGRCARCRRGMPEACASTLAYGHERMRRGWELSGAFATHVHVLSGTPVVVAPVQVPASVLAPASCETATAIAVLDAVAAMVALADCVVAIAGAGMLGLTAAALAAEQGARVVVLEPDPVRRRGALAFGASAVLDPAGGPGAVRKLVASTGRSGGRPPIATAFLELSGSPDAARLLLGAVDPGSLLVLAGSTYPVPELALSPERLVHESLTIRGVHEYSPEQLERAVRFLDQVWTRYPFADQVGEVFPLAAVDRALEAAARAARSGGAPRVAVSAR